jgi:poly-gamma-glutamate capsule biosynthesis protein CapA/YwtB (metallophosphatase superfamily)
VAGAPLDVPPPMKLALAGDTMLGRVVAERLERDPGGPLLDEPVVEAMAEADLRVLNLECAISARGERFPEPGKPFFFRAPPVAAEHLAAWGVDAVTLANNHALDYGADALLDTVEHLRAVGIAAVGAGPDSQAARSPTVLRAGGLRLRLVGVTDHPDVYAAGPSLPGVAFADLRRGDVPEWLAAAAAPGADADVVLLMPHWGPNMRPEPVAHVRRAAEQLLATGVTLVAGTSAHVFQGVDRRVLYDLGDFLDDYAVHPVLRNDLGLLWLVTLGERGPRRLEALPLRLELGFTSVADGDDARWVADRFAERCAPFGTEVRWSDGRLVVEW